MPVLAIVGQQSRDALGGHYQQEVDLVSLFKDVAGAFVQQASSPAQVRHLIDRAIRIAVGDRRVTAIVLPNDLQEEPYREPARKYGTLRSGVGFAKPRVTPFEADLRRAADVLNAGEKVAVLVGAGALGATDEVVAVAEKLGAGVAKALLGKAALPDDLPYVTGSIGLLGSKPSYALMTECDTLLMVGSGFPYAEFMPEEGQARGVRIDIEPDMLSLRYPMEVNLVGDSAETLRLLLPLLDQKTDRKWRGQIEKQVADWWKLLEERAMQPAKPVNPQRVAWELSPRLPDNVIRDEQLRLLRELVRERPEDAARHDGLVIRRSRVHGRSGSLRHCRQICASGSSRRWPRWRWGHANEQHGRAHHRRQILARVDRSVLGDVRLQQ